MRAYLSVDEIVSAARRAGADAVYPGYGFLSENPELAEACAQAGITFVGPPAAVLELTGNKARAIAAARDGRAAGAGVDARRSTTWTACWPPRRTMPFPVFVKAVAGGGGRGMRRVADPADAARGGARRRCGRPSRRSATPTVFLEQAVVDPRHIEVQVLADGPGDVVHLFERDCSVQRRHQKVVELAPAPNLDPRAARADLRGRGRVRPGDRLRQRRHGGVPARRRRPITCSSR